MEDDLLFTLIAALVLAIVHVVVVYMYFLRAIPRSRWLSMASGVSIAYVFVHIFPELKEQQERFQENAPSVLAFLEYHLYVITLFGFTAFYILERYVKSSGSQKPSAESPHQAAPSGVFWLHITSFSVYNALIGYLLVHREEKGLTSLLLFTLALALHFVVNDFGLHQHHHKRYAYIARWILAVAVLLGWVAGIAINLHVHIIGILFAFLAGGIVLNVIKEELPEDRKSSAVAFLAGVVLYTALLIAI